MTAKKTVAKKTAAKKAAPAQTASKTAKTERPARAESRAKGRPERIGSIGDFRDILSIENMDPEFRYRWVLGTSDTAKRIFDAQRAGWNFVDASVEQGLVIGEAAVGRTTQDGSVYRISANRGFREEYLYLMRISEDYAIEVDNWKQKLIDDTEASMYAQGTQEGQYGSVTPDAGDAFTVNRA